MSDPVKEYGVWGSLAVGVFAIGAALRQIVPAFRQASEAARGKGTATDIIRDINQNRADITALMERMDTVENSLDILVRASGRHRLLGGTE